MAAAGRWQRAVIAAVDINVATLGLLAARVGDLGPRIRLVHSDFLEWAVTGSAELPGPRLWAGNPPYTRHQSMSAGAKETARQRGGELVTSGLAGLSAYFLAATVNAIADGDVICYLLPGSWLDTRYGGPLRRLILNMANREIGLVGFPNERGLFAGTQVTAMALIVGPMSDRPATLWTANAELAQGRVHESDRTVRGRQADPLEGFGRWLWRRPSPAAITSSIPLSSVARIRRGVATGSNRFFLLTDEEAAPIPKELLRPALRSLREVQGTVLDKASHDRLGASGGRRWLLQLPPGIDLDGDDSLRQWRARATEAGVPQTYLASHRVPWFTVEWSDPPAIFVSPMGKTRMKIVRNDIGAVPSNAIYGIYVDSGQPELTQSLCDWLASPEGQAALLARARAYGSGLFKLEPGDLAAVAIPAARVHALAGKRAWSAQTP
jgi:hypothetical protein